MSCEEIEIKILNYQENLLSGVEREEVETHLAGCDRCQLFARQLLRLDEELSSKIRIPLLSAEFDRRLRERIDAAPAPLSDLQRAERKRQLQVEFETGKAQIRRKLFSLDRLLGHVTWAVRAIFAGWLTWFIASPLTTNLHVQNPAASLLPLFSATAVFLVVGMAEAMPQLRRFPRI